MIRPPIRILIATPVRAADHMCASVTVGYADGVRKLSRVMPVEMLDTTITYGCDVVRARNRLAAIALRDFPRCTHVLWWDDDQWPDDPRIVLAMLATGEHVIGAAYTRKRFPVRWVHQLLDGKEQVGDVLEVRSIGFGFTITSMHSLRKLSEAAKIPRLVPIKIGEEWSTEMRPDVYTEFTDLKVANIFGHLYDRLDMAGDPTDSVLLSEDFAFCKRWRDLGERVTLLCGGMVEHAGHYRYSVRDIPGGVA